jgi:hypothetical protein
MRTRTVLVVLVVCSACGGEDATQAKIGWRFDYKDPTDTAAPTDDRNCTNEPPVNPGPPYRAIDKVRVFIEDAEGQVPGSDQAHKCSLGYGDERVKIGGLVLQNFNFVLEAKANDDTVLYRYPQSGVAEINLAVFSEQTYALVPAVGELNFFATYDGNLSCPGDVASLDYSLFRQGETTATLTGTWAPACETGLSREIFIRDIPIVLDDPRETYNVYRLVLAAKNAGGAIVYCGENAGRVVRLGNNSLGGNEDLALATSCP